MLMVRFCGAAGDIDLDGDGEISFDEFRKMMEDEHHNEGAWPVRPQKEEEKKWHTQRFMFFFSPSDFVFFRFSLVSYEVVE